MIPVTQLAMNAWPYLDGSHFLARCGEGGKKPSITKFITGYSLLVMSAWKYSSWSLIFFLSWISFDCTCFPWYTNILDQMIATIIFLGAINIVNFFLVSLDLRSLIVRRRELLSGKKKLWFKFYWFVLYCSNFFHCHLLWYIFLFPL